MKKEEKFNKLKEQWKAETLHCSGNTCNNKHYQEIIEMGKDAYRFIIDDLKKEPDHWMEALRKITGANPVSRENLGNLEKMTKDWLDWDELKGF